VIGDRDRPIHPNAPTLPSELVVSGIFAPAENPADDTWLSFMSLEFVDSYRSDWKTDLSLIIVPKPGKRPRSTPGWKVKSPKRGASCLPMAINRLCFKNRQA